MKKSIMLLLLSLNVNSSDFRVGVAESLIKQHEKNKKIQNAVIDLVKNIDERKACVDYCYTDCEIETDRNLNSNDELSQFLEDQDKKTKCKKVCHKICIED